MSWTDRIVMLVAAGAIVATAGVGTCSTHARFDALAGRFDDLDGRFDHGVPARFDVLDRRLDDLHDDLQADIRALRSLVIEAITADTADDAGSQ
jgi:hypothetical protein